MNECDQCGTDAIAQDTALCDHCADAAWNRWHDRHDDIGAEE